MYYIVLGEFAGLFYSPVNWESFIRIFTTFLDNLSHLLPNWDECRQGNSKTST